MRVLVFCDDLHHPAATVRAGLAPIVTDGSFAFDWIENAADWNPACLRDYPAVLISKSNVCSASDRTPWLAGKNGDALGGFVRAGGGLLAVHSGTAGYQGWPRRDGHGRVAVLTPGHFPDVWLHAGMQQLMRNALRWVVAGC